VFIGFVLEIGCCIDIDYAIIPYPSQEEHRMQFSSDVLSIERKGGVGTLWLDRPEKRNAMSPDLWKGLPDALAALTEDGGTRAIVLAGKGKSFCVGLDLMMLQAGGGSSLAGPLSGAEANLRQLDVTREFQRCITAIAEASVPVICAIHGHCLGGGVDIATACDIRLASKDATFSVRETKIGIVADVGTLQRLPKVISARDTSPNSPTRERISTRPAPRRSDS
jgi:enoyl-CoA hydratase